MQIPEAKDPNKAMLITNKTGSWMQQDRSSSEAAVRWYLIPGDPGNAEEPLPKSDFLFRKDSSKNG